MLWFANSFASKIPGTNMFLILGLNATDRYKNLQLSFVIVMRFKKNMNPEIAQVNSNK